jgi:hypothetical protein
MYCLPHREQVVVPYFHQPDSSYRIARFHSVHLNKSNRLAHHSEPDKYLSPALHDMNVGRAVLAGRKEYANRKASRSDDGWQ